MHKSAITLLLVATALFGGCASITGTTMQNFTIQTMDRDAKELAGATCEMSNNKGKWFINTPGSTTITRSNDNLNVTCQKTGHENGRVSVVSATKGSMFGNILFGGGIGAIIDHNTGAAYEYPGFVQVMMGMFKTIEPVAQQNTNADASSGSAPR